MNFMNILSVIAENDVSPEKVFELVEKIQNLDLDDEENLRLVIREAGMIAGKNIDKLKEDAIVKKIKQNGINEDLLSML